LFLFFSCRLPFAVFIMNTGFINQHSLVEVINPLMKESLIQNFSRSINLPQLKIDGSCHE